MMCGAARSRINEYVDRELCSDHEERIEIHLEGCTSCRSEFDELVFLKEALAVRRRLPTGASEPLWSHIGAKARIRRNRASFWKRRWKEMLISWGDLESLRVWSRIAAVPLSMACFLAIMIPVQRADFTRLSYPVFTRPAEGSLTFVPLVEVVEGKQQNRNLRLLIDAVRSIPYEDSMSVVAAIDSGGHVEIDDVLQFPKSQKYLASIDQSVRSTSFTPKKTDDRKLILMYHKIDVFEGSSQGM